MNDSTSILFTCLTGFGLFGWLALSGMVYKSWHLNAIEVSFILNLGILAAATYYVKVSGGSQAAVAYISVGIAFLTFVGVVTHHLYMRIKSKVQCIAHGHQLQDKNGKGDEKSENHSEIITNRITHTEVDIYELQSPLNSRDTK